MSLECYRLAIQTLRLRENELTWFPKWVAGYLQHPAVAASRDRNGMALVRRELVIGFLQSLRDSGAQALLSQVPPAGWDWSVPKQRSWHRVDRDFQGPPFKKRGYPTVVSVGEARLFSQAEMSLGHHF